MLVKFKPDCSMKSWKKFLKESHQKFLEVCRDEFLEESLKKIPKGTIGTISEGILGEIHGRISAEIYSRVSLSIPGAISRGFLNRTSPAIHLGMPAGVPPKFPSANIALESHLAMPGEFSAGIT